MPTFVYELEDSLGAHKTVELTLPFDGEWRQGVGVPNGSLESGNCLLCLNANFHDKLVSSIFDLDVVYETSFDVIIEDGRITEVDIQFGIESDYNFDDDDEIRSKFIEKIESGYSIDSVLIS